MLKIYSLLSNSASGRTIIMKITKRRQSFVYSRSRSNGSILIPCTVSASQSPDLIQTRTPVLSKCKSIRKKSVTSFVAHQRKHPFSSSPKSIKPRVKRSLNFQNIQKSRELELTLQSQLKGTSPPYNLEKDVKIFSSIFDQIIQTNKLYAKALDKIKQNYHSEIESSIPLLREKEKLQHKRDKLALVKGKIQAVSQKLSNKFDEVVKDNVYLSKSIQQTKETYSNINQKSEMLLRTPSLKAPKDEMSWKYMLVDRQNKYGLYKELKDKTKVRERNLKDLSMLVAAIYKQGIPTDPVLEDQFLDSKSPIHDTELEDIYEDTPKLHKKPDFVPDLPSFSSNYYSSDDFY